MAAENKEMQPAPGGGQANQDLQLIAELGGILQQNMERDSNGNIKRDSNGKAILSDKGAEEFVKHAEAKAKEAGMEEAVPKDAKDSMKELVKKNPEEMTAIMDASQKLAVNPNDPAAQKQMKENLDKLDTSKAGALALDMADNANLDIKAKAAVKFLKIIPGGDWLAGYMAKKAAEMGIDQGMGAALGPQDQKQTKIAGKTINANGASNSCPQESTDKQLHPSPTPKVGEGVGKEKGGGVGIYG